MTQTKGVLMDTDPTPVQKAVHVFEGGGDDESEYGSHYAFTHGLAAEDLLVSARSSTGEPIQVKTTTQDENIVIVSKRDRHDYDARWMPGDRIIVLG